MPRAAHAPLAAAWRVRPCSWTGVLALLVLVTGGAQADLLGSYPHRHGTVRLMTDLCRAHDPGAGQAARQTLGSGERQGCWGVDRSGNPVITWSDDSELELDRRKLVLAQPLPPAAPSRQDFARPSWCPDAGFPHERLVCADAELAERDLRLASLWSPFRRTLSPGAEAQHKRDYFGRLKACGADKGCIYNEQGKQMRRYRDELPDGH